MTQEPNLENLKKCLRKVNDPRIDRTKRHKLIDILIIAILAVICGADSWVDVEMFANSKIEWLKTFLEIPNGIPSHDTFGRVFALINPIEFENGFMEWVKLIQELTRGQVIAIDGKQMRGSQDLPAGKAAIYMVSAWATANQLVLGQRKVDDKSNEISTIPQLLKVLELAGCIVVVDALGTQTKIAKAIIDQGADYILAVKENQGHLYEDIHDLFEEDWKYNFEGAPYRYTKTINKNHGRIEIRQCWSISDPEYLANIRDLDRWKGVKSLVMILSERQTGEKREVQDRYYITSLESDAKKILQAKRSYWGIENRLHWVLDIAFNEDHSRVRKDHAPQNFAILRHMALNLLKLETTVKAGIKAKRLKCGWDTDYLLKVLAG
ncbi:MAG: ISAs1 family transposase [Bellilinea sp.]|jgi:predicted transposase YbfD/YdcC